MTKDIITNKTNTIFIDKEDGFIRYLSKATNRVDWYTYNDDLLQILTTGRICPDYDKHTGRTVFETHLGGKNLHIRAHDLALGCYIGRIHAETFLQDWSEFVQYKREKFITIDHIDGHGDNLTTYNLSLMDASTNRKKGSIVQRIKLPNALSAVYMSDGRYRVEFVTYYANTDGSWPPVGSVRVLCEGAEEFADCLLKITEFQPSWAAPMKKASGRWIKAESGYLYEDTARSIERQAYLSRLDDSEFIRYNLLYNYAQI